MSYIWFWALAAGAIVGFLAMISFNVGMVLHVLRDIRSQLDDLARRQR